MLFHLEPNSGVPLYQQIVGEVHAALLKGHLRDGDRLPSVRELARTLGINPTTVVKAYDLLAAEHVIVQRPGLGAFITAGKEALPASQRDERVGKIAREFAIEGRRLGYSEADLLELLREALRSLRPRTKERGGKGT